MTCDVLRAGRPAQGIFGAAGELWRSLAPLLTASALLLGCSDTSDTAPPAENEGGTTATHEDECELSEKPEAEEAPDFLSRLGCLMDFEVVAADPLNTSIPGALSAKVFYDTCDQKFYYQNTDRYRLHYNFYAQAVRGGDEERLADAEDPERCASITDPTAFETTQYYTPDRRFILAAVTHYEEKDKWALEFASYDTASAEMIQTLYDAIAETAYFGPDLILHPTSDDQAALAPEQMPTVTTEELWGSYQPLNLGTAMGLLRFVKAEDLDTEFVLPTDIVVLDKVPVDISVTAGLITEEFQTPLSHVNVLAQNRGTPNMGLEGATDNEKLVLLEGKPVELKVEALRWDVREVTAEEADQWAIDHAPDPIDVEPPDLDRTDMPNIEELVPYVKNQPLGEAIGKSVQAFGGKASHYSVLAQIDPSDEVLPVPPAMAIPIYYYDQYMRDNGFRDRIADLLEDEAFKNDPAVRKSELEALRTDIESGNTIVDEDFKALLAQRLAEVFPDTTNIRFRSSTNAEDLGDFTGAGLYTSETGIFATDYGVDGLDDVLDAIKTVWASVWYFRTFEERKYLRIPHLNVGMALLVHRSYPLEEANGVAVTDNIFDPSTSAFYVNVQADDFSVVKPAAGVTTDQFLLYNDGTASYLQQSNLLRAMPDWPYDHVLSSQQVLALGRALSEIHKAFYPTYGPPLDDLTRWYAMDVEFKFDDEDGLYSDGSPRLTIKQARPYPGRGE